MVSHDRKEPRPRVASTVEALRRDQALSIASWTMSSAWSHEPHMPNRNRLACAAIASMAVRNTPSWPARAAQGPRPPGAGASGGMGKYDSGADNFAPAFEC